MLEESYYESIFNILPFLEALVNAFCGNVESAEVTETFTSYVNMVNFVFRRGFETCWNDESLAFLRSLIVNFKLVARETISKYQQSSLIKRKRHAIDHLCEALK